MSGHANPEARALAMRYVDLTGDIVRFGQGPAAVERLRSWGAERASVADKIRSLGYDWIGEGFVRAGVLNVQGQQDWLNEVIRRMAAADAEAHRAAGGDQDGGGGQAGAGGFGDRVAETVKNAADTVGQGVARAARGVVDWLTGAQPAIEEGAQQVAVATGGAVAAAGRGFVSGGLSVLVKSLPTILAVMAGVVGVRLIGDVLKPRRRR